MSSRLLYQFPISHFCEKTRWNLDYKGLDYRVRNLMPGPHRATAQRLARTSTLPILDDGGLCTGGSTAIALYLEARHPEPSLLAVAGEERQQVLALVHAHDELGEDVRLWIYSELLRWPDFGRVFFGSYAPPARWAGYAMTPVLRRVLTQVYRINPGTAAQSRLRVLDAIQRLEATLRQNPGGYLLGSRFTLADLTAAALFAPLLGPAGSPWAGSQPQPIALWALRQELAARCAGQWIQRLYNSYRAPRRPAR